MFFKEIATDIFEMHCSSDESRVWGWWCCDDLLSWDGLWSLTVKAHKYCTESPVLCTCRATLQTARRPTTHRHGDDVVHRSDRKYFSRYLHLQITLGLLRLLKLIITIHEIARSTQMSKANFHPKVWAKSNLSRLV